MFLAALIVDGALAGAIYAVVGLAFVVVFKASRMTNFALGEWALVAARLVAAGLHVLGLGLGGALAVAGAGMVATALAFNATVLRRLAGRPVISLIMVTIGLGTLMRGSAAIVFAGIPTEIPLPVPGPFTIHGVPVAGDRLLAAVFAGGCIVAVTWLFHGSRTGVALRAIADDQQAAMAMGIDLHRHVAITWALVGVLSVVAGTLWTVVTGGAFGVAVLGLKVVPVVILGGLDSVAGTIVGALIVGVLESVATGYLDPLLGGGFATTASYLLLLAVLVARPTGLFGRPTIERV